MRPETIVTLSQILEAGKFLVWRVQGMTLDQYSADETIRMAVERKFEIIGEAASRLARSDPETAGRITDLRAIISFRNRLAHGYDAVSDQFVWDNLHEPLALLLKEVTALLAESLSR